MGRMNRRTLKLLRSRPRARLQVKSGRAKKSQTFEKCWNRRDPRRILNLTRVQQPRRRRKLKKSLLVHPAVLQVLQILLTMNQSRRRRKKVKPSKARRLPRRPPRKQARKGQRPR